MARVDHEAVLTLGRGGEGAKETFGRFHLSAADLTDQMSVRLGCEMVGRGTVTQVRVNDDAASLELVEITVNRREMDVRRNALNLFRQFLGGPMRSLLKETAEQDPSRGGGAAAAFAQKIQDLFDPISVGRSFSTGVFGG